MALDNIAYKTEHIAKHFSTNRIAWPQFYESERVVIDRLGLGCGQSVLDIGCGCGGLGLALRDQFGVDDYTGVEINELAAKAACELNQNAKILCGDVLDAVSLGLGGKRYDIVFSLSCVDWNVRFSDMFEAAWNFVAPGGHLVATFRLTTADGCANIRNSYQYINYEGIREGEIASYVVLNAADLFRRLAVLDPASILAYGYWGAPSATAVTPYEKLCFAALALKKRLPDNREPLQRNLALPEEILAAVGG